MKIVQKTDILLVFQLQSTCYWSLWGSHNIHVYTILIYKSNLTKQQDSGKMPNLFQIMHLIVILKNQKGNIELVILD
jgi:hypothetical protein